MIFQVLHFWGIFLIYIHLRDYREVSLFKVIYFTILEKDFLPSNQITSLSIFADDKTIS